MKSEEMIIGFAYEELSEEEMMEADGGASWATVVSITSLPCSVGAGVGVIGVTVWYTVTH